MIVNPQVPLHRLILSLSEVLDYVQPEVPEHQQRVAYIAISIARQMDFTQQELLDLFLGAALHDIGIVRVKSLPMRFAAAERLTMGEHSEAGYQMLKDNPVFANAARIVRFHHIPWAGGRGQQHCGEGVPLGSHIVTLADAVERSIDRRLPVLQQAPYILKQIQRRRDADFYGEAVDALDAASQCESFWLDCEYERIYSLLLRLIDWPVLTVDGETLEQTAQLFGSIVDARSRWTATHSAGVASMAVQLAQRMCLSPREVRLMRTAGYLHDLGKLAVPPCVLGKPDKLNDQEWAMMKSHTYHTFRVLDTIGELQQINEWASFHHERLDGGGYPFRHDASKLTLGSRIMAVADIFTAVSEDRPYRKGKPAQQALSILHSGVQRGALDGDVVKALERDWHVIDDIRREEQEAYMKKQALCSASAWDPESVNLFGVPL